MQLIKLLRKVRRLISGGHWWTYDTPPYAPDGDHCRRCNFYVEKPWKWHNTCPSCGEYVPD